MIHSTEGLGWICPKCRYHNLISNGPCQNCDTGKRLTERIRRYFEKYGKPVLDANERWRQESHRARWP